MAKTILIIEDEPDVSEYIETVLMAHGYNAVSCQTVADALRTAEADPPDLICLDIMMPQETGISFYTRAKKSSALKNIPVVIVSGAIQQGEFDFRSYVPDINVPEPECYIEKPIIIDKFIETIGRLTEENSARSKSGK